MSRVYTIKEYGSFVSGESADGCIGLPERVFDKLENFILSNRNSETDAIELLGISVRRGVGKIITAKNYVGIITMNDGTTIEILPKIYSCENGNDSDARKAVIDMLRTLRNSPYKNLQSSSVNTARLNIFEVFIRMFIDEVFFIAKRGLKRSYETVNENSGVFKGKLLFSEQVKRNFAHKEKCFIEYDSFTANRPENRIIKTTLIYLYKRTASTKNKTDLKTLMDCFKEVDVSVNYKNDFEKIIPERGMENYITVLNWCRVFLDGKSFSSFSGSEVSMALLFPMETLFESYITHLLKRELERTKFSVSVQDKSYHLFDSPSGSFLINPDIVVTRKADGAVFVLDTKWKMLSDDKSNHGISQADMYQMYAYQKKYGAQSVTLVYPFADDVRNGDNIEYSDSGGACVRIKFIDLYDVKNSISTLAESFYV